MIFMMPTPPTISDMAPSDKDSMREECIGAIPQMTHCRQCRADAFGILYEDMGYGA